jgi:SAM-dependent methyltransferase
VTVLSSDESCRHRIDDLVQRGRCTFMTGDVVALPFPDRSFDVSLSFRLLTHCTRWPVLVRELCRVARHSVIVDYPTSQSLNAVAPSLFSAKQRLEGDTRRWTLFRHEDVTRAFADCGFRLHSRRGQFFLPMVLHRAMRCRLLSTTMEKAATACGLSARWGSPVIVRMDRQIAGEPDLSRREY